MLSATKTAPFLSYAQIQFDGVMDHSGNGIRGPIAVLYLLNLENNKSKPIRNPNIH
jgi:hypothetical protein